MTAGSARFVVPTLLVLIGACGEPESRFVALPDVGNATQVVVAFERQLGAESFLLEQVRTARIDSGEGLPFIWDPADGELRATLLAYEPGVELPSPGIIPPADSARTRNLPETSVRFQFQDGAWEPITVVPRSVEDFEYNDTREQGRCLSWTVTQVDLGDSDRATFALPLDEDTALVATSSGAIIEVDIDGTQRQVGLRDGNDRFWSAAVSRDGGVWLGGLAGRIYRAGSVAAVATDATLMATSPRRQRWSDISGSSELTPSFEVFVTSQKGNFERYSQTWEALPTFQMAEDEDVRVERLRRGRALAVNTTPALQEYLDGQTVDVALPGGGSERGEASAVANLSQWGTMVGTAGGHVFQRVGQDWTEVTRQPALTVDAIAEYKGGFLFGGEDGVMSHYAEFDGLCPTTPTAVRTIKHITVLGDSVLVTGRARDGMLLAAILTP